MRSNIQHMIKESIREMTTPEISCDGEEMRFLAYAQVFQEISADYIVLRGGVRIYSGEDEDGDAWSIALAR